MSKQSEAVNKELAELRVKILDIEEHVIKIETINNLLIAYADKHSPEVSILTSIIIKELEDIFTLLP